MLIQLGSIILKNKSVSRSCKRLRIPAWSAVFLFLASLSGAAPLPSQDFKFLPTHGTPVLTLNTNGALIAWTGQFEVKDSARAEAGEIRYRGKILRLESPQISSAGEGLNFAYHWLAEPALTITVHHELAKDHDAVVWRREIQIQGEAKLLSDLTVSLKAWPVPLPNDTWLPMHNGTGATLGTNDAAAFHFAGALPGQGARLALPMVSIPLTTGANRVLLAADPYFSALFKSNTVEWTYPAKGGLENGCEKRTVVVALQDGSVEESLDGFFRLLLPDVSPGPAWLHDIALVDFDYLSDGGQGWFRDVDAFTAALPKADRRRAFLCVHGCYDFLGRYCFDANTGRLDSEWTSFSSYEQARHAHPYGTIGGERVPMGFTNCLPQKMSLAEVHRRLRYARSRGFRAGIYFADGLNAGDGLPDFTPDRVLRWGGWQGPDSKGRSYFQNPLNPKVHEFFLKYTQAMLAEYGPDIDALIWDETFHVPCGQLGTDAWPGYADRAMMRLTREITALVEDYNRHHGRQIAFLTSDDIGALNDVDAAPYALVSHGTYQDSWCQPKAWSYGIFPNYRNVLWSCCWWPITQWRWVDFGAHEYQSPVSLSNGWGNDTGFSEMTPAERARVIELFHWRKQHRTRLRWFEQLPPEPKRKTVTWLNR